MKKRVLSAIVMILIFVPLLLIGGKAFAIFMTLLATFGLYELIKMRKRKENNHNISKYQIGRAHV